MIRYYLSTDTVGTIARLSNRIGGQNFTKAPKVRVEYRNASFIGEAYLTVQYDNANFGTGVNSITALDTNDRLEQTSTGAKANIMAVGQTIQHANKHMKQFLEYGKMNYKEDTEHKLIGLLVLQQQNILQMQVKALLLEQVQLTL